MLPVRYVAGIATVERDVLINTGIEGFTAEIPSSHEVPHVALAPNGVLVVREGYTYDGASGPTLETEATLMASLGHDVGYRLIQERLIPWATRSLWDALYHKTLIESGAHPWRAGWHWLAVRLFGGLWISPVRQAYRLLRRKDP